MGEDIWQNSEMKEMGAEKAETFVVMEPKRKEERNVKRPACSRRSLEQKKAHRGRNETRDQARGGCDGIEDGVDEEDDGEEDLLAVLICQHQGAIASTVSTLACI